MFQKNMEIVRLLLEHKFDVNAVGPKNGYTPLHDAVWADNLEAIKLLLVKGAKTNIKGRDGLTPYAKAKKEGKTDIVTYFESRGIKE
jgi:ankyrin repeat protein